MQEIVISNTWNELSLPYPLLRRAGGYPNLGKQSPSKVQMYKGREFLCLPHVPANSRVISTFGPFSTENPKNFYWSKKSRGQDTQFVLSTL